MKKLITTIVVLFAIIIAYYLIERFFFSTYLDKEPLITELKESNFDFSSTKPIYYKIENELFYSENGGLSSNLTPIWKGKIEEIFVSPNSQFALLYASNHILLIDKYGKTIFSIRDCTGLYAVQESRKTGRFISQEIQWSKNSDFFLITQDRVWDKNFSKKNKTSIYKYSISDDSFKTLIELNEELWEDFFLNQAQNLLYYEYATANGDLDFKCINITDKSIVSKHFVDDSKGFSSIKKDSIFLNFNKYKDQFQYNKYNLNGIITDALINNRWGLYYKDNDTTIGLIFGTGGVNAFKGHIYGFFNGGYFLPGSRYFIAKISAKNYSGELVIDTKTFETMKLNKHIEFYFNINSYDCDDIVFRGGIHPKVNFPTSVALEIEGRK